MFFFLGLSALKRKIRHPIYRTWAPPTVDKEDGRSLGLRILLGGSFMKRLVSVVVSVLLAGLTSFAFAQGNTGAGSATNTAPAASSAPAIPKYPGKVIEKRIQNQRKRIRAGVKSKKLTADEAKDLSSKVDAVRDQLKADAAQNKQSGVKRITDDQYNQLKQMLDDNSKAIHDDKNDGETDANASPAAGSPSTETAPTTATNQ
jgi:hypothetical protein